MKLIKHSPSQQQVGSVVSGSRNNEIWSMKAGLTNKSNDLENHLCNLQPGGLPEAPIPVLFRCFLKDLSDWAVWNSQSADESVNTAGSLWDQWAIQSVSQSVSCGNNIARLSRACDVCVYTSPVLLVWLCFSLPRSPLGLSPEGLFLSQSASLSASLGLLQCDSLTHLLGCVTVH